MVTVIFAVLEVLFRTLTTVVKLLWMLYINFYKELESTLISWISSAAEKTVKNLGQLTFSWGYCDVTTWHVRPTFCAVAEFQRLAVQLSFCHDVDARSDSTSSWERPSAARTVSGYHNNRSCSDVHVNRSNPIPLRKQNAVGVVQFVTAVYLL